MPSLPRPQHRRQLLRLNPNHPNPRIGLLQRTGNAPNQPAPANWNHHRLHIRHLLQQLQSNRPLPADHFRIIERVNESPPLLHSSPQRLVASLVVAGSKQNHLSPIPPRRRHLDLRSRQRHHNLRPNPPRRRMKRHPLRMVSRARRNHPTLPLRLAQRQQLVQRPPLFERPRPLQVLKLQMQRQPRQLRQMVRKLARRYMNAVANPRARCLNTRKTHCFQWAIS